MPTYFMVDRDGQAGQGFEQLDLDRGIPVDSSGLQADDLKDPFRPKPFYNDDSMTIHPS